LRELQLSIGAYFRAITPQVVGTIAMVVVLLLLKEYLHTHADITPLVVGIVTAVCGLIFYVAYFAIFHFGTVREIFRTVGELRRKSLGTEVVHEI
jgi:hypothetical protein